MFRSVLARQKALSRYFPEIGPTPYKSRKSSFGYDRGVYCHWSVTVGYRSLSVMVHQYLESTSCGMTFHPSWADALSISRCNSLMADNIDPLEFKVPVLFGPVIENIVLFRCIGRRFCKRLIPNHSNSGQIVISLTRTKRGGVMALPWWSPTETWSGSDISSPLRTLPLKP